MAGLPDDTVVENKVDNRINVYKIKVTYKKKKKGLPL